MPYNLLFYLHYLLHNSIHNNFHFDVIILLVLSYMYFYLLHIHHLLVLEYLSMNLLYSYTKYIAQMRQKTRSWKRGAVLREIQDARIRGKLTRMVIRFEKSDTLSEDIMSSLNRLLPSIVNSTDSFLVFQIHIISNLLYQFSLQLSGRAQVFPACSQRQHPDWNASLLSVLVSLSLPDWTSNTNSTIPVLGLFSFSMQGIIVPKPCFGYIPRISNYFLRSLFCLEKAITWGPSEVCID